MLCCYFFAHAARWPCERDKWLSYTSRRRHSVNTLALMLLLAGVVDDDMMLRRMRC